MMKAAENAGDMTIKQGTFAGIGAKNVAGTVTIKDGNLVLSGFSSDEGPDLHVYLANGSDGTAIAVGTELGTVADNQAEQIFALGDVDPAGFTEVVIYCTKAKVPFGTASLT